MEQVKTGKFIAELRRELNLTQREVADSLNISDKTVSKWERGGGMPEVSLMLPLCRLLGISVNELLLGEKVSDTDYKSKAEVTIMNLFEDNQKNKKNYAVSIIIGVITIIAVLALVCLAAFLPLPVYGRILLIVFAAVVAVAGIGAAVVLDRETGAFVCPHCGAEFTPSLSEYVKGIHTTTRRKLTCPECGKSGMCKHVIVKKQ